MNLKKILFATSPESSFANEVSITLLRVFAGLAMAFGHGLGKIPPSEKFLEGVAELGFPMPEFFGWAAGISEFVGGLLLAAGLLTRPSGLFIAITMAVAGLIRHADDPFKAKELAFLYLFVGIAFAVRGAGKFSIDALLHRK